MITLYLPKIHHDKLHNELTQASKQEIGGILMGEQLVPGRFRISEITYQRRNGTIASFVRNAHTALKALKKFFYRTNEDYSRFNYLGEWHSHPSFSTNPSTKDHATMLEMTENHSVKANFLVLLIVKLNREDNLEATVTTYLPNGTAKKGTLIMD